MRKCVFLNSNLGLVFYIHLHFLRNKHIHKTSWNLHYVHISPLCTNRIGTNLNFQNKDYSWTNYIDCFLENYLFTHNRCLVTKSHGVCFYLNDSSPFLHCCSCPNACYLPLYYCNGHFMLLPLIAYLTLLDRGLGIATPTIISPGQHQSVRTSIIWSSYDRGSRATCSL